MKCRYGHCKHDDVNVSKQDGIKVGSMWFHPDCYHEKEVIAQIKQYWVDHFERDPVWSALVKIINNLIYNKHVDADFLLFALQFAHDNHLRLQHPPGMYYLVKRDDVRAAWEKRNRPKMSEFEFGEVEDLVPVAGYDKQSKPSGFGRIMGA